MCKNIDVIYTEIDYAHCRHCTECKKAWTAGDKVSCHDGCDDYQRWLKWRTSHNEA